MLIYQNILRNTSVLVLGQFLCGLISFINSIFIARWLGPAGYGEYAFIYAFLGLFGWLISFGMDNILVREASQNRQDVDRIWVNGWLLQTLFAGIATFLMLFASTILAISIETVFLLIIGAIEVFWLLPFMLVYRILQVELQQWRSVLASLSRQLIWLGLVFYLARGPINFYQLIWARSLTAIFEIFILYLLSRKYLPRRFKIDPLLIRKILIFSWPLALTSLSIAVYHRIDRVLIAQYLNAYQLGLYATADNIASLISIVPIAFMTSVYPVLSKLVGDLDRFNRTSNISFRWVIVFCVGMAGFLTLLGPTLTSIVYGDKFLFSGEILRVLSWAQVSVCYGVVISQVLISQNLQRYILISTTIGAVVNLIGNLIVLPIYGVLGAAWVTVISYSLSGIFIFLLFPSTRQYSTNGISILLKASMVTCLALGAGYIFRGKEFFVLGIYLIIFLSGIWLFHLFDGSDIKLVLAAIPKLSINSARTD
jgi:O-antigen/teichoic acid export membrane protein